MRRGILLLGVGVIALGLILMFAKVIGAESIWIFVAIGALLGLGSLIQ